jgi:hypothetical protein
MSQSVSEPTEEEATISGIGAGVEVPDPLPTESVVRSGVNNDIFITLRQLGCEPAIHFVREKDAADLHRLLSTVLNEDSYRENRPDNENENTTTDDRPLTDNEIHRLLQLLPVEADVTPVRDWLLGDRASDELSYRDWLRLLQVSPVCIKWSTDARGCAGHAEWRGGDGDGDGDGNLRVRLSTGTEATGERATSVLVDIVDDDTVSLKPVPREETPFSDVESDRRGAR